MHASQSELTPTEGLTIRPRTVGALGVGLGIATGTFSYVIQRLLEVGRDTGPLSQYGWIVLFNIIGWVSWLALVPLMLWLSRRVKVTRDTVISAVAVHLAAALAITAVHCMFTATVRWAFAYMSGQIRYSPGMASWQNDLKYQALFTFEWEVLLYGGIIAMDHAVEFYRELQQRAIEQTQLEGQLVAAQLEALQRQLHPHFLFNTLHAIASLVHRNPGAAETMIVRLGDLLRAVFRSQVQQQVPLAREIELVRDYVEIQRVRYGGTLSLDVDLPEDAARVRVPILVLQPLVENAIKHGFDRASAGWIHVGARRVGDMLELTVRDNGRGITARELHRLNEGIGLSNTRARLEHLFPSSHQLSFRAAEGGGFAVTITLPWEEAVMEAPDEPTLRVPA